MVTTEKDYVNKGKIFGLETEDKTVRLLVMMAVANCSIFYFFYYKNSNPATKALNQKLFLVLSLKIGSILGNQLLLVHRKYGF